MSAEHACASGMRWMGGGGSEYAFATHLRAQNFDRPPWTWKRNDPSNWLHRCTALQRNGEGMENQYAIAAPFRQGTGLNANASVWLRSGGKGVGGRCGAGVRCDIPN